MTYTNQISMDKVRRNALALLETYPITVLPLNKEDQDCRHVRLVDAWLNINYVNEETLEEMAEGKINIIHKIFADTGRHYHVF